MYLFHTFVEIITTKKECWPDFNVKGNVKEVKVFKGRWIKYNLPSIYCNQTYTTWCEVAEEYQITISRKKYEISESRKMWLLCAKRLKVVPDIRKLIGKMFGKNKFQVFENFSQWRCNVWKLW